MATYDLHCSTDKWWMKILWIDSLELSKKVPFRMENFALLHSLPLTVGVQIQYIVLYCFIWHIPQPHNEHCWDAERIPTPVRNRINSCSFSRSHKRCTSSKDASSVDTLKMAFQFPEHLWFLLMEASYIAHFVRLWFLQVVLRFGWTKNIWYTSETDFLLSLV